MPEMDITVEEDMNKIEEQEEYDMLEQETDLPQSTNQSATQTDSLDSSTW